MFRTKFLTMKLGSLKQNVTYHLLFSLVSGWGSGGQVNNGTQDVVLSKPKHGAHGTAELMQS